MTACVLIISMLTGEVVGCLPPEKVAAGEITSTQWERLLAALEEVKK